MQSYSSRVLSGRFQSTLPTRGSDAQARHPPPCRKISIHAPHEGERPNGAYDAIARDRFQSTLPTRGSDSSPRGMALRLPNFNPRSPRGGATFLSPFSIFPFLISIHAPHEGERRYDCGKADGICGFQSTLPTRGSDARGGIWFCSRMISIHAPHEGERPRYTDAPLEYDHFNPRSPRGGATLCPIAYGARAHYFNPRSPRGGATPTMWGLAVGSKCISIHAPHEGERLVGVSQAAVGRWISIHAPHEGERPLSVFFRLYALHFNPRSPRGGATKPV